MTHSTPPAAACKQKRRAAKAPRPACPPSSEPPHIQLAQKLELLPRDVGVALMGLGTAGVVIPGPIPPGFSFVLLGSVFVFPRLIARFGGWLSAKCPSAFRLLIAFVDHLHVDLAMRYPGSFPA